MKTKIITIALLIISSALKAQDVSYKKIYDDPDHVAPLKINIEPLFFDLAGISINAGSGIRANYTYKKLASIELSSRFALLDINAVLGSKHHSYSEVIGTYHLSDKTKETSLPVTLSSSSNGSYTTTNYINVPGKKRIIKGVRIGFYKSNSNLELKYKKYKSPFFGTTDAGERFDFSEEILGDGNDHIPNYSGVFAVKNFVLNFGVSYKTITNLKVQTDYSKRAKTHKRENDIYVDFLLGAKTAFGDLVSNDNTVWHMNNEKMKNIGLRFGYIMKRGAFTYKTEIASRPGAKGGNLSLMQVLAFTIPVHIGPKPEILN